MTDTLETLEVADAPEFSIQTLFEALWDHHVSLTPAAPKIHALLEERGETLVNDHIALRTFNRAPIHVDALCAPFLGLGYVESGSYRFETKQLLARSLRHPSGKHPRVFVSELVTEAFSSDLQATVDALVETIDPYASTQTILTADRTWPPISIGTYERLRAESEYAAWVAAFGVCANHFTISVNALTTVDKLADLNALLCELGFALNEEGGIIKGGRDVLLEQSSTLADRVEWAFEGGETLEIPGGYCEFARRYHDLSTGSVFEGFVPQSADRIFESTSSDVVDANEGKRS